MPLTACAKAAILAVVAALVVVGLAVGLGVGLTQDDGNDKPQQTQSVLDDDDSDFDDDDSDIPSPVPNPSLVPNPSPVPNPSTVPNPSPNPSPVPAPSSNPSLVPNPSPNPSPVPVPSSNPSPVPTPSPNPSPVPVPSSNPSPVPVPSPNPSPVPVPSSNPSPVPVPSPNPSPVPVPSSNPSPVPTPSPNPSPIPVPSPNPSPVPAPSSNPSPVPVPSSNPSPVPVPSSNPSPVPVPSPNPSPVPVPSSNPSPVPSSNPSPVPAPSSNPSPAPVPSSNPSPVPAPSPNPSPVPVPSSNPSPVPVPSSNPSPVPVPSSNPSPVPVPSPNPSPVPAPSSNPSPVPSSNPSPVPVPSSNPSPVPVPSPNPSPVPVPSSNPSPAPVPSPNPSPVPVPSSNPSPVPVPSSNPSPAPVPSPNPSPVPVPSSNPSPVPVPSSNPSPNPVPSPNPSPVPVPSSNPSPVPVPSSNPSPNPVPSPNPSPVPVPSPNPSPVPVPSSNPSPIPVPSPNPSPVPVPSPNPSPFPTPSPNPSPVPTPSPNPSPVPVPSPNPSPVPTPSPNPSPVPVPSPNPSPVPTPSPNPSPVPTPSPNPSPVPTPSPNPSPVPTPSPNPSPVPVPSPNPSPVPTPSPNPSPVPVPSPNPSPVPTPSPVPSPNPSPVPTPSPNPSPVPVPSPNPSPVPTPSPNPSPIPVPSPNPSPVPVPSPNPSPVPTPSPNPSPVPVPSPNPSPVPVPSPNPSPVPVPSPNPSPVPTPSPNPSPVPVPSPNPSPVPTPSPNPSPIPVPSPNPSPVPVPSPNPSPVPAPSPNPSPVPVPSPNPSPVPVPSPNPSPVPAPSPNPSPVPTPSPNPSPVPVPSPNPSPVPVPSPNPSPVPAPSPVTPPGIAIDCDSVSSPFELDGNVGYSISRASSGNVCMLLRVDLSSLTSEEFITPLGRSYDGYHWEPLPPFHPDFLSHCDSESSCSMTTPVTQGNEKIYLYRYSHTLSQEEEASRFLNQATFGATVDLLNDYVDSSRTPSSFIQDQMDESISTELRKIFRAQNFRRARYTTRVGLNRHPCHVGSRWRNFVYVTEDHWFTGDFVWARFEQTAHGTYLVKVNNRPRAEYDSIPRLRAFKRMNSWRKDVELNKDYPLSNWGTTERPDGIVRIRDGGPWRFYDPGNPPVQFLNPESIDGLNIISLTDEEKLNFVVVNEDSTNGAQIVLTTADLSDEFCASIPIFYNYFDTYAIEIDGKWFINDPGIILEENTVNNPIPDGGGESSLHEIKKKCSNVPRNFMNEEGCILSPSLSACDIDGVILDPDSEDPILNEETLANIFALTHRYVYIIDNLRLDPSYEPLRNPCLLGVTSRWLKIDGGSCVEGVFPNEATKNELRDLLLAARGDNEILIDIVGTGCTDDPVVYGITIEIESGACYQNVHQNLRNVYDMSYWAQPDTHPGNGGNSTNPITRFAEPEDGGEPTFTLQYGHPALMSRWENNFGSFTYIGRAGDSIQYADLPDHLQTLEVANYFGTLGSPNTGADTVVCGSPGEVGRDITADDIASLTAQDLEHEFNSRAKAGVLNTMVLKKQDQLRQRVAWALSQILVVSPGAIEKPRQSEAFLNYYDIFVRNAFGNYFDVVKEVAYSPMMAEMLSFLNSRSRQHKYNDDSILVFPDENFAREIMQLFTIGLVQLNPDGTVVRDGGSGAAIENYDNEDITVGARLWTGFERQNLRSNTESATFFVNRIDPMRLVSQYRDRYPKMDLYDGYVGDGYPLCHHLPSRPFLRKGAKFRVLGEKSRPELQVENSKFILNDDVVRLTLDPNSPLYQVLCAESDGSCTFPSVVTLDTNLNCFGVECEIEMVSVLKMGGLGDRKIHYEYVRSPCVDLAFMSDALMVQHEDGSYVCGNPKNPIAVPSCCPLVGDSTTYCKYVGEYVTFEEAENRCSNEGLSHCSETEKMEEFDSMEGNFCAIGPQWYWSSSSCSTNVKVDLASKEITLVHYAPAVGHLNPADYVRPSETVTWFRVNWEDKDSIPSTCETPCSVVVEDGSCMCPTSVVDSTAFDAEPSDLSEISSTKLHIGSVDPRIFDAGVYNNHIVWNDGKKTVLVWVPSGGSVNDMRTVFEFTEKGVTKFFRNMVSGVDVQIGTGNYRFRNTPNFNSMQDLHQRDAMYETDAYLTHLVFHDNTAPFIAVRLLQRFGFSNPSGRFVKTIVEAFTEGKYTSEGGAEFGIGKYGDLAATVAAILLDREARSAVLDADPISGSLKEPLMRVLQFVRAMDYELNPEVPRLQLDVSDSIGQEAFELPSVFSFFLPEYSPPGILSLANLVSPEATVLNTPKALGLVGGLLSMVKYGLADCEAHWTPYNDINCPFEGQYHDSVGRLTFTPGNLLDHRGNPSTTHEELVDELALLLTPGRLSPNNREILLDALLYAHNRGSNTLRVAQQLMVLTPEFHTTNFIRHTGNPRPPPPLPATPAKNYKAIVFFFLPGGVDSYNLLIPHSGCTGRDLFEHYSQTRGTIALEKNKLLQISAADQICDTFGLHPSVPFFKELYEDGDLSFFANAGVLHEYSNKYNYRARHKTQLFAHNVMTKETEIIDAHQEIAGTGVLGRAMTRLRSLADPYLVGAVSLANQALSLVGQPGISEPVKFLTQSGVSTFDPRPSLPNMSSYTEALNAEVEMVTSLYGETWSSGFFDGLHENAAMKSFLDQASLATSWDPKSIVGQKMEIIAKLISVSHLRGTERDVFFINYGNWDSHADVNNTLINGFNEVNAVMQGFINEIKAQGKHDQVLTVFGSEFGRTMTPNGGAGSDHGWGGNYWMLGGDVKGGKIHGTFPDDLSDAGILGVGRGRLVPTMSWEEIWNGVFEWFGLTEAADLDYALPNRDKFTPNLFSRDDLFKP